MTAPIVTPQIDLRLKARIQVFAEGFASLTLKTLIGDALAQGKKGFPILRTLRIAVRSNLDSVFDGLAMNSAWSGQRLSPTTLILLGTGYFVILEGTSKPEYCSMSINLWAESPALAEAAKAIILSVVDDLKITEPLFSLDWRFMDGKGEIRGTVTEERADDVLLDSAYPSLGASVDDFITRYLQAPESVLVLQGPPGTGKTRLIRAILGAISRRQNENALALYTGDNAALESDAVFIEFITGDHHAFVVEDADHLLSPRADGNRTLHRFLNIADGVARAQGRKVIFSTNLPNVRDIDDALVRPGRCFAHVLMRELKEMDARRLLAQLCGADHAALAKAWERLFASGKQTHSIAAAYAAYRLSTADMLDTEASYQRAARLRSTRQSDCSVMPMV